MRSGRFGTGLTEEGISNREERSDLERSQRKVAPFQQIMPAQDFSGISADVLAC